MKICTKCNVEKEEVEFNKYKKSKDGLRCWCKKCYQAYAEINRDRHKKQKKEYYKNNKEKIKKLCKERYDIKKVEIIEQHRGYYRSNKEKIKEYKINYQQNTINRERRNRKQRERYKNDTVFKLTCIVRGRLKDILKIKGFSKSKSLDRYLGCTKEEFTSYIESKFYPNPETGEMMTWNNHGKFGWHIDHIVPISSATTPEEVYKLSHYTNLQPLWAKENLSKGNKIV